MMGHPLWWVSYLVKGFSLCLFPSLLQNCGALSPCLFWWSAVWHAFFARPPLGMQHHPLHQVMCPVGGLFLCLSSFLLRHYGALFLSLSFLSVAWIACAHPGWSDT